MGKKAVLIGINYPGTNNELNGCVNDVRRMRTYLMQTYGFEDQHINVLIDNDPSYTQPTGKNIRAALENLVQSAQAGDELFVHYSGHGTRLDLKIGDVDYTGFHECIVPCDFNLITDDDFKEIVSEVHDGSRLTIVSDSCHSGGLITGVKEQIGESTHHIARLTSLTFASPPLQTQTNLVNEDVYEGNVDDVKSRALPVSALIDLLKEKTGNPNINVGNLGQALFDFFGDDASPTVGRAANANKSIKALPRNGILLSGCQADETSADVNPSGNPKDAYGAFSNAIMTILDKHKGKVSNHETVSEARTLLKTQGFTQRPGLYCSDDYDKAPFLY